MRTAVLIARRVLTRLVVAIPALAGVVVVTFILMRVLPGDPAAFFASGPSAGQQEIDNLRREMGLDEPIHVQLGYYLRDLAQGKMGRSLMTGQAVEKDLLQRLPASLELTFFSLFLAFIVAIPLGMAAALRQGSILDHGMRLLCTLGVCMPTFVAGLLFIYLFYYILGWAPDPTGRLDIFASRPPDITGFLLIDFAVAGDWEGWRSALAKLLLPATTMALFVLAPLARMTRASMLSVLGSDFIRTARAVGMSAPRIAFIYALRNALLPVLTISGIVFSFMLGANVLVEKVFSWPGMASYALDAILASDYAPVQGFILTIACLFVLVNLLVDILYGIADPRVSIE